MVQKAQMTMLDREARKHAPTGDATTTFARICKLADERRDLWLKGGLRHMPDEECDRCEHITAALAVEWDNLRRETAAGQVPEKRDHAARLVGRRERKVG